MKRFGPFLLFWCMLIALGVLISEFGYLKSCPVSCAGKATVEECVEELEERGVSEETAFLSMSVTVDPILLAVDLPVFSSLSCLSKRFLAVHPAGWLMPARI